MVIHWTVEGGVWTGSPAMHLLIKGPSAWAHENLLKGNAPGRADGAFLLLETDGEGVLEGSGGREDASNPERRSCSRAE